MAELRDLTARLVDAARRAGADAADAMAVQGSQVSVDVRGGRLEEAQRAEGIDLGLRVLIGRRQAVVSSSDAREATLGPMAERAVAMAREAPEDPSAGLADASELARDRDMAGLELADASEEPDPARLEADARQAEAAALAVPGVTQVESAGASWSRREVFLSGTNGFGGGYARTGRSLSCGAISGTGTGMERDWTGTSASFAGGLRSAERSGAPRERAVRGRGAEAPGRGPSRSSSTKRVGLVADRAPPVGDQRCGGRARVVLPARRMGEMVLPEGLSVTEDPHRPRSSASRLWDAEGAAHGARRSGRGRAARHLGARPRLGRQLGLRKHGHASRRPGERRRRR
jgi:PmbA protein